MARAERKIWVKGDPSSNTLGDCPFCHRALLTLELKGLEYEKGFIDFSNKPDWLFDVNEKGTVPVLKEGDDWYSSSDDICEYLGKTFPEPDLGDIKLPVGEGFMGAFVNYLTDCKEMQRDPEKEKALKDEFQKIEDWLGSHEGDYFGGCSLNAVDCALGPRLYHASVALPKLCMWDLPEDLCNVKQYVSKIKLQDAFQKTDYGEDMIVSGWKPKVQASCS